MSTETIVVYIDLAQIDAQKSNNYSLYLAKKVNGAFTIIWQSRGVLATVGTPSYEYKNTFDIALPAYQLNYGNITETEGAISFTSGGKAVPIELGQKVSLNEKGLFGAPKNGGTAGALLVDNKLAGNPHEILNDSDGNPVFINRVSGMDIGTAELTPVDEYQVWFDSYQATGTIIAHNASNPATVTFSGGTVSKTINYTSAGKWEDGEPASLELDIEASAPGETIAVIVAATFSAALTAGAVTYLLNKLIAKFSSSLKPSKIKTSLGSFKLEVTFCEPKNRGLRLGLNIYEQAVNNALQVAVKEDPSSFTNETWTLSDTQAEANF
ncbi:hypothetical protein [Pseudomonas fluorescens]|uniref:hypothetical protein n=1 Tax=Pseudomonas fluorescens TaxID=294 RepID=UPI001BEBE916|nr:hypothetical protein [Pseudomonas fluorescens]MBT2372738.1 hypothetical protein [Pseudomonas fluorescens]